MAKPEKEKCPKCGSTIFAKATDKSGKLYCQAKGCGQVWVPGLEGMKRTDVVIKQLQLENQDLKKALNDERAANKSLSEQLEKLLKRVAELEPNQKPVTESEIFS